MRKNNSSSRLKGALKWSAAEEAAARISAVREGLSSGDNPSNRHRPGTAPSGNSQQNRVASGLKELDAIRRFIHDGITLCNQDYLDGGAKDQLLHNALERGLQDLEQVRSELLTAMKKDASPSTGNVSGVGVAPPQRSTLRQRTPSASHKATSGGSDLPRRNGNFFEDGGDDDGGIRDVDDDDSDFDDGFERAASRTVPNGTSQRPPSFIRKTPPTTTAPRASSASKTLKNAGVFRRLSAGQPSAPLGPSSSSLEDSFSKFTSLRPPSATSRNATPASPASPLEGSLNGRKPPMAQRPPSASQRHARPPSASQRKSQTSPTTPQTQQPLSSRPTSAPAFRPQNSRHDEPTPVAAQTNPKSQEATDASQTSWGQYHDWAQKVLNRVQTRRAEQQKAFARPSSAAPTAVPPARTDTKESSDRPTTAPTVQTKGRPARPGTAGMSVERTSGTKTSTVNAKLNPQSQALREQGNVHFQQKRYKESAEAYSRAIEVHQQAGGGPSALDALLYCNRSAAFLMLNKCEEALADSLMAIDADPVHVKAHWRGAKSCLYLGRSDQAKQLYREAHRLALAEANGSTSNESEAIAAETKAVDISEKCRKSLRLREWKETLKTADQLLEIFPLSGPCSLPWVCLKCEAMIHMDPHEVGNTLAPICEAAVCIDSAQAEAWYLRGKALFYAAHDAISTTSAMGYLKRSKEMATELSCSDILQKVTNLMATVESFSKLRDQGNNSYASGKWTDAFECYSKCLSLDSSNLSLKAIILCNRAAVCIQCERWKDALDDINLSINYNGQNAKAYTRRARIHQHNNNLDGAVKDLQTAVQMYPSSENQERLNQAIEQRRVFMTRKARGEQQQQSSTRPASGSASGGPSTAGGNFGAGGSFRYFFQQQGKQQSDGVPKGPQRPFTAGAGRSGTQFAAVTTAPVRTHYEILGVVRTVDERGIVRAYRDAALKWHPDKWASEAPEKRQHAESYFKEISLAYNTLKDADKRRLYDLV